MIVWAGERAIMNDLDRFDERYSLVGIANDLNQCLLYLLIKVIRSIANRSAFCCSCLRNCKCGGINYRDVILVNVKL